MPRILALLMCFMTLVALPACGGEESRSAEEVLREAFGEDKPIKSGRLDARLKLDVQGGDAVSGPVDIRLRGPFESNGGQKLPSFDFDASLTGSGLTLSAGAISTGSGGFVKFQGQTYDIGKDLYDRFRKGYEDASKDSGQKDDGPSLKSLGIDPLRWLRSPKTAGEEEVGGAETDHVTAQIDVPKLLEDVDKLLKRAGSLGVQNENVPQGLDAKARKAVEQAVKGSTFDVWAGKEDGTLRRIRVTVSFDVPESARQAAGGLTKGTIALDVTIADLNEDQEIKAPSGARPLEELTAQFAGAAGGGAPGAGSGGSGAAGSGSGASGSGASGSGAAGSGSGSGAAPSGAQSSKYLQCLEAAGADLGKVQECQDLLGQ